jgi:hypothetical protein
MQCDTSRGIAFVLLQVYHFGTLMFWRLGRATMRRLINLAETLAVLASAFLVCASSAIAGQFKTLNTANLAPGELLVVTSSPKNWNDTMELEMFEWLSADLGGTYRCSIRSNSTGAGLTIRMIGANGADVGSCTAPADGTCHTRARALAGGLKFACLVSTQAGTPVSGSNPTYRMSVSRH